MKKSMKSIQKAAALMLSATMVMSPVMEAIAANQFSVEAEDVTGKILFPGDSISGIDPVYLGPDGTQQELTEGRWVNNTSQAYSMSGLEEGGLWLEPKGYVLTVKGGTSSSDSSDGTNHFAPKDGSGTSEGDIAYYEAWGTVRVTAADAEEGKAFDHWEVSSADVTLADPAAAETSFTMIEAAVTLTAVYADAAPQTEAPQTEAPQTEAPQTEAPAEVTEAPAEVPAEVTEAPTEAPAEVTEAPTEAPTEGQTEAVIDLSGGTTEAAGGGEGMIVIGDNNPEATYTLTVENGIGSGEYTLGTIVSISAEDKEGMVFGGWTTEADTVWLENSSSPQTTFSMPAEPVTVTANYVPAEPASQDILEDGTEAPQTEAPLTEAPVMEDETIPSETEAGDTAVQPETGSLQTTEAGAGQPAEGGASEPVYPDLYTVTVENGEGTGTYEAGYTVNVYAGDAEEGQQFQNWTTSDNVVLEDSTNSVASFVMPASNVTLTANFVAAEPETYPDESEEIETVDEEPHTEQSEVNGTEASGSETESNVTTETPAVTEAPITEAPVTEAPATEAPVTEAPVTESETVPVTEAPTEAPTEAVTETETATEADTDQTAEEPNQIQLSDIDAVTVTGEDVTADANGILYAPAGKTVTLTAKEYDDKFFQNWQLTRTDDKSQVAVQENAENYLVATFTMPDSDVYVEAIYEALESNQVQIVDGTGSGTYTEGDYVEITANKAPAGYRFKQWIVVTGDVELDDETEASTGFTMPAGAVQVKAVYEQITYKLTVNSGDGSGSYLYNSSASLSANWPASGKEFASWNVTTGNATVTSPDRYYSSLTMPAADVTVEATYKDGPSPDANEIQNIAWGGEYLKGQTITFTAVGNGMSNGNPNPGDYRYRPSGYQIGSVTGGWSKAPYTTSMAINATGEYTLTVTYSKDVFDGNTWNADGSTVTKSVKFYVVNALSVQTGDSSPIIPLAVAAVVALLVIIAVVVFMRKRRR
ncbi:MAG: hypothetical protein PHR92_15675 [Lachnospiraceae bacterium]|nr:hypothetical protein [Lachnospiraceae bacterium]